MLFSFESELSKDNEERQGKTRKDKKETDNRKRKTKAYGGIAQLGEHLPCKQGVKSSNLFVSTKTPKRRPIRTYLENCIHHPKKKLQTNAQDERKLKLETRNKETKKQRNKPEVDPLSR